MSQNQVSQEEIRVRKEAARQARQFRYLVEAGLEIPSVQAEKAMLAICPELHPELVVHLAGKVTFVAIMRDADIEVMAPRFEALYVAMEAIVEYNKEFPTDPILYKFVKAVRPLSNNQGAAGLVGPVNVNKHAGRMTVEAVLTSGLPANLQSKSGKSFFAKALFQHVTVVTDIEGNTLSISVKELECRETRSDEFDNKLLEIVDRELRKPFLKRNATTEDEEAYNGYLEKYEKQIALFPDGIVRRVYRGVQAESDFIASVSNDGRWYIDSAVWEAVGDAIEQAIPPKNAGLEMARRAAAAATTAAGGAGFDQLSKVLV